MPKRLSKTGRMLQKLQKQRARYEEETALGRFVIDTLIPEEPTFRGAIRAELPKMTPDEQALVRKLLQPWEGHEEEDAAAFAQFKVEHPELEALHG